MSRPDHPHLTTEQLTKLVPADAQRVTALKHEAYLTAEQASPLDTLAGPVQSLTETARCQVGIVDFSRLRE